MRIGDTVFALLTLGVMFTGIARAGIEVIDPDAHYPEGPLWDHGRLLYVEYAADTIKSWDGSGTSVWWHRAHCGSNGLIHFRGDHILVACYDGNYLVELDSFGHEIRTIDKDSEGHPFIGPNDFSEDGHGGIYFTASGIYDINAPITGAVLHISANGNSVKRLAETIDYANGLTLDADGTHLLVAEMLAQRIISFPIEATGALGPRVVWARLRDLAPPTPDEDAYNGPDGIKLGSDGNYYIAQNGSGRVLVVDRAKKLVRTLVVPTPYVTNVGFGGHGADEVFITGGFDPWKPPFPGAVYRWTP